MTEEGESKVKDFVPSKGLTTAEAQELLQKWGRNELEDKKKAKVRLRRQRRQQRLPDSNYSHLLSLFFFFF